MKNIRRAYLENKIRNIDFQIDHHLNRNEFLECQELEQKLTYFENQLLETYSPNELQNLHNEAFPE